MAEPSLKDEWSVSDPYDTYIGRWSRLVAKRFLAWLALPSAQRWLDLGCGTGAVTQVIVEEGAPASVVGVDPSEGFIVSAHSRMKDARARFQTGSAHAIPLSDAAVDAAVCGLVLNFTPDPAKAVAEMKRVVRPGGTVAAYVWDYAGDMQMLRLFWDAATALDPGAHALDEGRRFPICSSAALLKLWNEFWPRPSRVLQPRCVDHVQEFRGLLVAVPGRAGAGPDLLRRADRTGAGKAARSAAGDGAGNA